MRSSNVVQDGDEPGIAVLMGIPIDNVTMATAIERLGLLVEDGRRNGRHHQVATVNVDFLVNADEQPDLRELLQNTSLNLADGMPLLWAASLLGTPLSERVAGADLVPLLAKVSQERGWRIHLFGGGESVAERAQAAMLEQHPGATITCDRGPVIEDPTDVDDEVVERIAAVDADIVCVALGNPKQERFIHAHGERVGAPVMIGVGGSLDMLVGDKRRAPTWAQRTGMEWIFRAAQEPTRLGRRYAHDARAVVPPLVADLRAARRHRDGVGIRLDIDDARCRIGFSDDATVDPTPCCLGTAGGSFERIDVDFTGVTSIQVEAHARLIEIFRIAQRRRVPIEVDGWSDAVGAVLADYRTAGWIRASETD